MSLCVLTCSQGPRQRTGPINMHRNTAFDTGENPTPSIHASLACCIQHFADQSDQRSDMIGEYKYTTPVIFSGYRPVSRSPVRSGVRMQLYYHDQDREPSTPSRNLVPTVDHREVNATDIAGSSFVCSSALWHSREFCVRLRLPSGQIDCPESFASQATITVPYV